MNSPDPVVVTPAVLRAWPLPAPGSGKESRGHLLVVGGGASTPGAVLLAGEASLRAGAGKLALATVSEAAGRLAVAVPEAQVLGLPSDEGGSIAPQAAPTLLDRADGADAVVVGPGFHDVDAAVALLEAFLPDLDTPVVVDALASAYLTEHRRGLRHRAGRAVLTVNLGELAATAGQDEDEVADDPLPVARQLARESRVVVLAGGHIKHVVTPDGDAWRIEGGGPGLGVSGSGDMQAGVVAGLLARGADAAQAAVWGGYVHARCGDRLAGSVGVVGYLARELLPVVPVVLAELS